jgi:GT2 family glycosyltransferase
VLEASTANETPGVGIVVITRDRRDVLLGTLERLRRLPQRAPVVVVDNASRDGTAAAVRRRFPEFTVLRSEENLGTAARTKGAELLDTPIVAFADDDSWWADDALDVVARAFAGHPRLGLVAARVLVGTEQHLDPTCASMRASALPPDPALPGPRILGCVACGAAVRRAPFLGVGGFERRLEIGGEETLLAIDLASSGWALCYLDAAVVHHHPDGGDDRPERDVIVTRNELWTLWLRRPVRLAARETARVAARARRDPLARQSLSAVARGAPWLVRNRRRAPASVERDLRILDRVDGKPG